MKEKSELVQQYEEMVQAKDELTTEVSTCFPSCGQQAIMNYTFSSDI